MGHLNANLMDYIKGPVDPKLEDNIRDLLNYLGEKADREGLRETPKRFIQAMREYTLGYRVDPKEIVKMFSDGAQGYDEMIVVDNLPIHSLCEHHLAPFVGVAHIGYIPNRRIVGLSKLPRLVDIFARRLQVQARLTVQIADCLEQHLKPKGVGVVTSCVHMCMECRGVRVSGSHTTKSALRGVLKTKPAARAEFLQFALMRSHSL